MDDNIDEVSSTGTATPQESKQHGDTRGDENDVTSSKDGRRVRIDIMDAGKDAGTGANTVGNSHYENNRNSDNDNSADSFVYQRNTRNAEESFGVNGTNDVDGLVDDSGRVSEVDTGSQSVNSFRVPTQAARARLIRTPKTKDEDIDQSEFTEPRTVQTEPDILITELKDQGDAQTDEEEGDESDIEPEYKQVTVETVNAEEDWDTDLEIEDHKDAAMQEVRNHDPTGRAYYDKVCCRMGLVPVSYMRRHITDPEITMRYHGLGASAAKAIALVLRDNITLEKLNLQGNWIMPEGGMAMARMLEENDYITELVLSDNKLGSEGAKCLCKMLSVNAGLRKLDLSGNNFDDRDAVTFAEALENTKYLKDLSLARNQFGSDAGEILGPAISANDILEVLDLSWNHIRGKGAIAVAKGIGENVRLKVCDISWNGFGPEGGAAISDAMATNNSLLELDISGNRLTSDTALRMSRTLTSNDNIRILRMGNNILTTAGSIVLATAINNTESGELEELDLTDVPVEYEFLRIFEDIKGKKPDFRLKHGQVMSSGNTPEDLGKPAVHPYKLKEPVLILNEHIVVNDMRLLDVLQKYDPEGGYLVTPDDFVKAVEELAVPFNKPKLQAAVAKYADTQQGRIYFGDFVKQREESLKNDNSKQRVESDT